MCILKIPVLVLHVQGFSSNEEAERIAENGEFVAKRLVATINGNGSIVHMVEM